MLDFSTLALRPLYSTSLKPPVAWGEAPRAYVVALCANQFAWKILGYVTKFEEKQLVKTLCTCFGDLPNIPKESGAQALIW